MSRPTRHRRLSPVRACVLLIVVYLAVCAALFAEDVRLFTPSELKQLSPTLFADEPTPVQGESKPSLSTLFAEKKPPARHDGHPSFAPAEEIRVRAQRTQRTQRGGDDRVGAFYDGYLGLLEQQKRDEAQKARDAQRSRQRSRPMHYGHNVRRK
jgi:hypothetical protein